jgi:hypothetical protein
MDLGKIKTRARMNPAILDPISPYHRTGPVHTLEYTRDDQIHSLANRLLHSKAYKIFYLIMAIFSFIGLVTVL